MSLTLNNAIFLICLEEVTTNLTSSFSPYMLLGGQSVKLTLCCVYYQMTTGNCTITLANFAVVWQHNSTKLNNEISLWACDTKSISMLCPMHTYYTSTLQKIDRHTHTNY